MSSHAEFIESVLEDTKQKLKDYERRVKDYEKRVEALEGLNPRDEYFEYKLLVYREKVESTKIHIEVLEEELEKFKSRDLFEYPEELPEGMVNIIDNFDDIGILTYDHLEEMLEMCEAYGYTFEYGLDAVPFNLRKIK